MRKPVALLNSWPDKIQNPNFTSTISCRNCRNSNPSNKNFQTLIITLLSNWHFQNNKMKAFKNKMSNSFLNSKKSDFFKAMKTTPNKNSNNLNLKTKNCTKKSPSWPKIPFKSPNNSKILKNSTKALKTKTSTFF